MIIYLIKRLLLFVPSFLVLSILVFHLLHFSSGDPALNAMMAKVENSNHENSNDFLKPIIDYREARGMDKAVFYFSIQRLSHCDTIYKIPLKSKRVRMKELSFQLASSQKVTTLDKLIQKKLSQSENDIELERIYRQILESKSLLDIQNHLDHLRINYATNYSDLKDLDDKLIPQKSSIKNYLPKIRWHGTDNQYHRWLTHAIKLDFGNSYADHTKVWDKISNALPVTLLISIVSLVLALLFAIPLGVYAAYYENSKFDRYINSLFFAFYSLPTFWVATLLVIFLGSKDYLYLFPTYGLGEVSNETTLFEYLQIRSAHLVLPVFCYFYGGLAYLFRHIRRSTINELKKEYVKTALSKGISVNQLLWNHTFKKSSLPLITILGNALPGLIAGSFVIEFIFSIQGMGKLTIDAFFARDYPVIFSLLLIGSFLTMLGVFIADLCYAIVDPRVRFENNKLNNLHA